MKVTDAVLWAPHPALMLERAAGLTVLERQLFLLRRAGLERVWVGMPRPERPLRLPPGLDVRWGTLGGSTAPVAPPYLALSGDHLVRLDALKDAAAQSAAAPVSWQDEAGRGVLQVVLGEGGDGYETRRLPAGSARLLTQPASAALDWLLQDARKASDGFMARNFDRRISLAVTRRLLDTRVSPNHMTLASVAIGLAGAGLMAAGGYGPILAGSLLVWLHSTLDGCDGELARLRFQESPLGGVLDFWGDNVVHAGLFLGLGLGVARGRGEAWPLALGAVAAASAAASAALAYAHSRRRAAARGGDGPFFAGVAGAEGRATAERRLAAVEDALAQRDFVYLLAALAALGRAEWFLWASAVGSPLFLAVLAWLHRRRV